MTEPTNCAEGKPRAVWPEDSVIDDYIRFMRGITEAGDDIVVATILPVVGALLGKDVWVPFAGKKYPNLYHVIAAPPGIVRKSTTLNVAETVARAILPEDRLMGGAMSPQTFFEAFHRFPDQLWFESEGNVAVRDWSSEAGKAVPTLMLKTYDVDTLRESYMRNKSKDDDDPRRYVEAPSLSFVMAITTGGARLPKVSSRDGLRRRFCYYLAVEAAREIVWPADFTQAEIERLAALFESATDLEGPVELDTFAMESWRSFKSWIDRRLRPLVDDPNPTSEAAACALSEAMSHVLKRATIFQVCRHLKNRETPWNVIDVTTLDLAIEHEKYCLEASAALDQASERAQIREQADQLLAKVRSRGEVDPTDALIIHSKSEITSRFANNPGRPGAITTDDLYNKILPDLIRRGLARLVRKEGRSEIYGFAPE